MLYFDVNRVMRLRHIANPYRMLIKNGFVPATARKLVNNQLCRVDLSVIEKLCLTLNCTPNDFFSWLPSQESQVNPEAHALIKLKRDQQQDVAKLLATMPMEKFDEVAGIIQNLNTD